MHVSFSEAGSLGDSNWELFRVGGAPLASWPVDEIATPGEFNIAIENHHL